MKVLIRIVILIITGVAAASFLAPIARAPQPVALERYDLELPLPRNASTTPTLSPEPPPTPPPAPPAVVKTPTPHLNPAPPQPPPPPAPDTTLPQELGLSDQMFYAENASAVIQIFCITQDKFFAGSGTIVNERGLVLTNAHVAEIVRDAGAGNCQARHGNPADPFAKLEVIFIADTNAKIGAGDVPQTDFAFVRLTGPTEPFRVAVIDSADAGEGAVLFTLGYPSEFLQVLTASNNANLVFSSLVVAGLADIDGDQNTAEAYLFRGGIALQQGSSGTAIFNAAGNIVGLMFATTKGTTTANREGVALTMSYIDRALRQKSGQGLREFITTH